MIHIHIRDLKNGTFWVNFNDTSLIFDDIELEGNEAWSQICSRCAERHNIHIEGLCEYCHEGAK